MLDEKYRVGLRKTCIIRNKKLYTAVSSKLFVQTGIFDPPVIVLQANWELYTSDRGEIRVY